MSAPRNYFKKPVIIEAIQWTGENLREIISFTDGPPDTRSRHAGMKWEEYEDLVARDGLKILTLEGKMSATVGDWIIRGIKGEYYPCKPDIFAATYGKVEGFDQGLPRADLCDPTQDVRVKALEAENARLREAGQAVVDEYPVSAGTSPGLCGDECGYGSIYRLRAALRALEQGEG